MLLEKIWFKLCSIYYDINSIDKFVIDDHNGCDLPYFKFVVKQKLLAISKSKPVKISAVYRLKNVEDFLFLSVSSIVPLVSEIIFVDNCSTDKTRLIIEKACKLCEIYNVSYKIYNYNVTVNTQGKRYKESLIEHPEGSLAKYYNFAFSKASYDYVFKIDAHMILKPIVIDSIFKILIKNHLVYLRGQNLYGRSMEYEPRIYKKSLSNGYTDGDFFEFLDLKVNRESLFRSCIYRRSYWHVGLYSI